MIRALTLGAAALTLACSMGFSDEPVGATRQACTSDFDCRGDEVCFPDGCGDPGKDIVVEVVPSAVGGQLAQDFPVEKIQPIINFEAYAPPVIQGVLTLEAPESPILPFDSELTIRATGESTLIPGRSRSFKYTVQPDQGAYQIPVSVGQYAVSLTPSDPLLPPKVSTGREVGPGEVHELNQAFPAPSALKRIDGRLLQTAQGNVAVQSTTVEVQAFDPTTDLPLSQKVRVSSGQPTSTGDFYLYVEQGLDLPEVHLRATPADAQAMVPTKTFLIPLDTKLSAPLELGDFGTPVTVGGRLLDAEGRPVSGATVFFEGRVGGGGTFRSPRGSTDEAGRFMVRTLPSAPNGVLTLYAVPPAYSDAGLLRMDLVVPQQGGELGEFSTPEKIAVQGRLVRPDGAAASGVQIRAEAVAALEGHPLPSATVEGATNEEGVFVVRLDPAVYRLDFLPADFNPRVSRFVTVRPIPSGNGLQMLAIDLPEFQLSRGRTVTGTISSIPAQLSGTKDPVPAPNASVKFFRVVTFEGRRSHLLLAEGLADGNGGYSVVLPTR